MGKAYTGVRIHSFIHTVLGGNFQQPCKSTILSPAHDYGKLALLQTLP